MILLSNEKIEAGKLLAIKSSKDKNWLINAPRKWSQAIKLKLYYLYQQLWLVAAGRPPKYYGSMTFMMLCAF